MKKLKITLKRSLIGKPEKQRRIVRSLGLRKLNQEVIHRDTPSIRGMIHKISHMVEVSELEASSKEQDVKEE
jgi:large subunit ribosomal protein L30